MGKLAIISIFILFYLNSSSAKINKKSFDLDVVNGHSYDSKVDVDKQKYYKDSATVWVLSLNDNFTRLKPADKAERKVFRTAVDPAIKSLKSRSSSRVKKDDPLKNEPKDQLDVDTLQEPVKVESNQSALMNGEIRSMGSLRKTIAKYINKHLLSSKQDPTQSLKYYGTVTEPTLKLYFKGFYASLVLQSKYIINHYLISPDSSMALPNWFYKTHKGSNHGSKGTFVEVPDVIKKDFYEKLETILESLLGYPV